MYLDFSRVVVVLHFIIPSPLSSHRRKIFRGANPVASIDQTNKKGNVTKYTSPSSVRYMIPGKLSVTGHCLYFMKGIF